MFFSIFGAAWHCREGLVNLWTKNIIVSALIVGRKIVIESIINARPLTYVYDDTESVFYPLTPSHLISGRRITNMANNSHFEVVSTNNSSTRRVKHHRTLLRHFTNDWRRNYLLNLRENSTKSYGSRKVDQTEIAVGDIVLIKSDSTSRNFWKLARVEELVEGRDGKVRSAVVKTISDQGKPSRLRRVLQHLVPLEIHASVKTQEPMQQVQPITEQEILPAEQSSLNNERFRRQAVVAGELRRRYSDK